MVAAVWIVRKLVNNKQDIIDGIETVVVNNDDGDSEAVTLAAVEAALVALGHPVPSGYFDSADLALTDMSTDMDLIAAGKRVESIA